MQINWRGKMRNSCSVQPYSPKRIFGNKVKKVFYFFLSLIFVSSSSSAQKIADKLLEIPKKANITVGSPIDNEATKKVLEVIDRVPGLSRTIHRYNERYGNDSVHALRYVDREPDEKAEDTLTKNYYDVVVVSDSAKQTSRWYSFLVRKDLQEVRYYDLKNGKTGNTDDWKKIWPASEFLNRKD